MSFSRAMINICSDNLPASRDFYIDLLDCRVNFDSDWYVQLRSSVESKLELGIIQRNHQLVPPQYQVQPTGMYITFVVPDVDEIYQKAVAKGLDILQSPQNEFYGQRRFLTVDPNGCLLDISSPM